MTADLDLRAARRRIWLQADSPRTIRLLPREKDGGEPVDATAFTLEVAGTPQPVEPVATDPEVGERRFTFTPEHSAQVAAAKAATWALRHADAGVVATGPLVATTDGTIAGVDDAVLEVFVGDSTWVVELAPILGGGGGGDGAVASVNGKTGAVVLGAADVGADPAGTAAGLISALDASSVGAIPVAEKGAPGGVAELTAGGKLPTAALPALAITDTFPVDDEASMLALTAQRGDVAVRSDLPATFILAGDDPADLGEWVQLPFPPDSVLSVNGQTGVVVLTAASVGAATAAQGARADTAVQRAGAATTLWVGTESEYEAIDPKDPGTVYLWTEDP